MQKVDGIARDRVLEVLNYEPETGLFRWKIRAAKNTKIGAVAGTMNGGYRYIKIDGVDVLAARLAWLVANGAFPKVRLRFRDGDIRNCAIENLYESQALHAKFDCRTKEGRNAYNREHRKQFPDFYRNSDLKKDFGLSLADYNEMLSEQNGKCAICKGEETVMRGGKLKALAVDHNHKTGEVRQLLCQACNMMVGFSREAPEVMREAAAYLERHATKPGDTNMLRDLAPSSAILN